MPFAAEREEGRFPGPPFMLRDQFPPHPCEVSVDRLLVPQPCLSRERIPKGVGITAATPTHHDSRVGAARLASLDPNRSIPRHVLAAGDALHRDGDRGGQNDRCRGVGVVVMCTR